MAAIRKDLNVIDTEKHLMYRKSLVGVALWETIEEMVKDNSCTKNQLECMEVQFDYSIVKLIKGSVHKKNLLFQMSGEKLITYRASDVEHLRHFLFHDVVIDQLLQPIQVQGFLREKRLKMGMNTSSSDDSDSKDSKPEKNRKSKKLSNQVVVRGKSHFPLPHGKKLSVADYQKRIKLMETCYVQVRVAHVKLLHLIIYNPFPTSKENRITDANWSYFREFVQNNYNPYKEYCFWTKNSRINSSEPSEEEKSEEEKSEEAPEIDLPERVKRSITYRLSLDPKLTSIPLGKVDKSAPSPTSRSPFLYDINKNANDRRKAKTRKFQLDGSSQMFQRKN